jgi:geranylgeranyl reductase family protein
VVTHDVLIIGGGPAGASCAAWLADAGADVVVVEKKHFPREKTCGDGLTPRAVRQLGDLGIEDTLTGAHRFTGLRALGFGQSVELDWPTHPRFPNYGYTVTRHDLDAQLAERARKSGAQVLEGCEAIRPLPVDGVGSDPGTETHATQLPACGGAEIREDGERGTRELRARFVVVADGSNSRFGRALGTSRERAFPMGLALRGYYESPRHDEAFIESHLDIRDISGRAVPGYGWIFPMGDGRVNVGVGLLSTDRRWKGINTTDLMTAFVERAPASWELRPETACGPATGGKLPMGHSVGPRWGPNVLTIGDASGAINPFNGEGIAYGYETGRLAADVLLDSLGPAALPLSAYGERLEVTFGAYYRGARLFVRILSHPQIMRACVGTGLRSKVLMAELLRLMANLMRPEGKGPAELASRALSGIARLTSHSRAEA